MVGKANRMMGRSKNFVAAVTAAIACAIAQPTAVVAQGPVLEVYTAFLGPADHFNSAGARLTQPWQVIRQDRANFHRYGIRDQGDQYDGFFASSANRSRMEQMILHGYIDPNAGWRIVNQNVWITVEVYANSVSVNVQ